MIMEVNMINKDLEIIFTKYNVIQLKTKRYYIQDLFSRAYDLENTYPYLFFLGNEIFDGDSAWLRLLVKIVKYLQNNKRIPLHVLYNYRVEWSNAQIFGFNKFITNSQKITEDLYMTTNFTGNHALWLLQDLLDLYDVPREECALFIHRSAWSEPKEVQDIVIKTVKDAFIEYLRDVKDKDGKTIERIIKGMDVINGVMSKISKSYGNFYLIDNTTYISNSKAKLFTDYPRFIEWNNSQVESVRKILDYYSGFATYYLNLYKTLNKYGFSTYSFCKEFKIGNRNFEIVKGELVADKRFKVNQTESSRTNVNKNPQPSLPKEKRNNTPVSYLERFILLIVLEHDFGITDTDIAKNLKGTDPKEVSFQYFGKYRRNDEITENSIRNAVHNLLLAGYLMYDEMFNTKCLGLTAKGRNIVKDYQNGK